MEEERSASDLGSQEDPNPNESVYLRGKVSLRAGKWMPHL